MRGQRSCLGCWAQGEWLGQSSPCLREKAGTIREEPMTIPMLEPSVLAIHMALWAAAYFGVNMGELGSRLVCVAARLRDRVKEQKG